MEAVRIHKIARVLNALVLIALVCNIIILYLVPVAVVSQEMSDGHGLLAGAVSYLGDFLRPGEDDILSASAAASFLAWFWCWKSPSARMLTLFLVISGICTAIILWQGRRVLRTILRGTPFSAENAVSLRRAAVCAFVIAGAALVRVVWSIWFHRSLLPLVTYNALFVPIFAMAGLLCLVMSALFCQAAEMKSENDLTI